MSLGQSIKSIRKERDITQEKLAEYMEVSVQAVSAWERDEYYMDLAKFFTMADYFDVSLDTLAHKRSRSFEVKKDIYNWEHMKTFVKTTAKYNNLTDTLKALDYAVSAHQGQTRRKSDIPYIYHPLNLACHALSMNIHDDDIISACLLHDVIEDCDSKLDDLPVNDNVKELVNLLTHEATNDNNRDRIMKPYYEKLTSNPKASLIKLLDICNNTSSMAWGLSHKRIVRSIREADIYYPALLKAVRSTPKYNDAAFLLQYHIESMLNIYKSFI